jgi:hypothetical protein
MSELREKTQIFEVAVYCKRHRMIDAAILKILSKANSRISSAQKELVRSIGIKHQIETF